MASASNARSKSTSKSVSAGSGSRSKSSTSTTAIGGSSRGSGSSLSGTTLVGSNGGSGNGSNSSGSGTTLNSSRKRGPSSSSAGTSLGWSIDSTTNSSRSGTRLVNSSSGSGSKSSNSGTTLINSSSGSGSGSGGNSGHSGKTLPSSSNDSGSNLAGMDRTLVDSSNSATSKAAVPVDSGSGTGSGSRNKSKSAGKGSIPKPKATPVRKPSVPKKAPGTIIKRGLARGLTVPSGPLPRSHRTRQAPVRLVDEIELAPVRKGRVNWPAGPLRRPARDTATRGVQKAPLVAPVWPKPRAGKVWWPEEFELPVYQPGHPGAPWYDCPEERRLEILATPGYKGGPPPKEEDTKLWAFYDRHGYEIPRESNEWLRIVATSAPTIVRHRLIDEYWDSNTRFNVQRSLAPVKWWPRNWGEVWLHGQVGKPYYDPPSHVIRQILQIPNFRNGMLPPTNCKGEYDISPIRIPGKVPNKAVDDYWDAVQTTMRVPWWPASWSPVWAPGEPGSSWMPDSRTIRQILQLPGYRGGQLPPEYVSIAYETSTPACTGGAASACGKGGNACG